MDDKANLAQQSGLSTQQVQNWFINMRKRHWTPMMNGKRRPRTFLDYVILSSQQGGKEEELEGPLEAPAAQHQLRSMSQLQQHQMHQHQQQQHAQRLHQQQQGHNLRRLPQGRMVDGAGMMMG
jgi:hypothetical protein